MKMKIAAALLLTGSVQASEIDDLISTSNSLVAQIDRGRMLVGAAIEIAAKLKIDGVSNYVRISELKKQAVQKLINNVDHSQVIDYL
jgi:outer membrane murein-binding lipoprotein Lpp